MTDYSNYNDDRKNRWERRAEKQSGQHHIWTGLFLLAIGGIALIKSFGVPVPNWLFSWQMLLIGIGLFIGIRSGFNDGGWFVPIIIGGIFFANDYILDGQLRKHMWPLILIIAGVFFIFRRSRSNRFQNWSEKKNAVFQPEIITPLSDSNNYSQDDFIDNTCIFSGTKKVIVSKNFKGGDLVTIFGGAEIDLTQADINGTAVLEVTAIFGGATLVVPSHWVVKSEAVTIFGGIDDKRRLSSAAENNIRTLVVKGTVLFGGMEIKSF